MLCSRSARLHFLKNGKKERNSWLLFSQPDVRLRRGALDRYNTGKFLCQSRGSCPIDIQFVLLYKKKDFTLPFFSNHCFVYACLQISFQVSQTSYFPSIYLVNAYFLLSFFPVSFKKPLKNLKRMQGELRILPRAMHVEFYPVDCMKLHLTPWLVIFLMSF